MTLDPSLTWKAHIKNLKQSCIRKMDALKCVCSRNWGADRKTLLRLYMAVIKLTLDYGYEAYGSACQSLLNILKPVQNAALRLAVGAYKTSPVISLHCEAAVKPMMYYREIKNLN